MRTLVTGGTGFVGANLVRRLVAAGDDVHVLLRPAADQWRLTSVGDVRRHTGELLDTGWLGTTFRAARPERVFHLASHGGYSFQTDFAEMARTNVAATANLLWTALATGCNTVVHTGSSSEYGSYDRAPGEDDPPRPNSYYALTKASATALCVEVARQTGLHCPTLRLYSVYGPYEDERRLMPTLIRSALEGRWPLLASPAVVRDYVYVDDVVEACLLASDPSIAVSAIYNIGTGVQTSLAQLTTIVRTLFAIKGEPGWGSYQRRAWDVPVWVANSNRARTELGWESTFDVRDGLRSMAAFIKTATRPLP